MQLPVTALDVRKVQNIVKEIYAGGNIKVSITEDLDTLKNGDKILAIGSSKTIQYQYQTGSELLANYFNVIDESNSQILSLIDKYKIQPAQYFPIFGFSYINKEIQSSTALKKQQVHNVEDCIKNLPANCSKKHKNIDDIINDQTIPSSYKMNAIIYNAYHENIDLDEIEKFLRENPSSTDTSYRKLLSVYDLKKYNATQ